MILRSQQQRQQHMHNIIILILVCLCIEHSCVAQTKAATRWWREYNRSRSASSAIHKKKKNATWTNKKCKRWSLIMKKSSRRRYHLNAYHRPVCLSDCGQRQYAGMLELNARSLSADYEKCVKIFCCKNVGH